MKDIIQWVTDFIAFCEQHPELAGAAVGVGSLLTTLIYGLKRWIKK